MQWFATKWLPLVACSTIVNTALGWLIINTWPGLGLSLTEVACYAFAGAALMGFTHLRPTKRSH